MKVIPETCHVHGYGVERHFQHFFSYIVVVSFIGAVNWISTFVLNDGHKIIDSLL